MIEISKLNEVYIKVSSTDRGIEEELKEHFTFHVPGYKFMPAFKKECGMANLDYTIQEQNKSTQDCSKK